MSRLRLALLLLLALAGLAGLAWPQIAPAADASGRTAVLIAIDGPIGPATSDHVARGLEKARERSAAMVILRIDTPGGLDTSMRAIIRDILAAPLPVVAFVAPSGAHAASAGTYILYASHVAAMAPGTNLGAATPVQIGAPGLPGGEQPADTPKDTPKDKAKDGAAKDGEAPASHPPGMTEKAVNDAVAYIRSLAQLRGRNAAWAEKAVREAASLSAEDALQAGVIEIIAADVPALMRSLNGREVPVGDGRVTLATDAMTVVTFEADWRTRLLSVITNPNVASLLMLIGVYGLILEFYSPGLIGPGVVGAICLLLALYAFHVLPVDYTGVALLMLGVGMMVAEAFIGAFGVLGIGGLAAFVIGAVLLMREDAPGFTVAWELVGGVALALGGMFLLLSMFVVRARRRPVVSGREEMPGSAAVVLAWDEGDTGRVRMHGEMWQARSATPLRPGQQVRVRGIDGLTLQVEPEADTPDASASVAAVTGGRERN